MDNQQQAKRPAGIRVDGPLAPFTEGMRAGLAAQGYAGDTITDHVHLLADLSGWLGERGLTAADLTSGTLRSSDRRSPEARFPDWDGRARHDSGRGVPAGRAAAPPAAVPGPRTPREELLAAYRAYLAGERGVAEGTIRHYLRYARGFLDAGCQVGRTARSRGCPRRTSPDTCWNGPQPGTAGARIGRAARAAVLAALPARVRRDRAAGGGGPGRAGPCRGGRPRAATADRSAGGPVRLRPGSRHRAAGTTRSCWRWRGWRCAAGRSPGWSWMTSAGGPRR